jgi:hypothetical protein
VARISVESEVFSNSKPVKVRLMVKISARALGTPSPSKPEHASARAVSSAVTLTLIENSVEFF